MVFAVNTPAQHAFAEHLADPQQPYLDLPQFYQAKRDLFTAGLANTPFRFLGCGGTYFVLADYSRISDLSEAEFAKKLIADYGVAAIPVSVFYDSPVDHRVVRFCLPRKKARCKTRLHVWRAFLAAEEKVNAGHARNSCKN